MPFSCFRMCLGRLDKKPLRQILKKKKNGQMANKKINRETENTRIRKNIKTKKKDRIKKKTNFSALPPIKEKQLNE